MPKNRRASDQLRHLAGHDIPSYSAGDGGSQGMSYGGAGGHGTPGYSGSGAAQTGPSGQSSPQGPGNRSGGAYSGFNTGIGNPGYYGGSMRSLAGMPSTEMYGMMPHMVPGVTQRTWAQAIPGDMKINSKGQMVQKQANGTWAIVGGSSTGQRYAHQGAMPSAATTNPFAPYPGTTVTNFNKDQSRIPSGGTWENTPQPKDQSRIAESSGYTPGYGVTSPGYPSQPGRFYGEGGGAR